MHKKVFSARGGRAARAGRVGKMRLLRSSPPRCLPREFRIEAETSWGGERNRGRQARARCDTARRTFALSLFSIAECNTTTATTHIAAVSSYARSYIGQNWGGVAGGARAAVKKEARTAAPTVRVE